MNNFNEILGKAQFELSQIQEYKKQQRIYPKIDKKEFAELFNLQSRALLLRKNQDAYFDYDEFNKPIISELFQWFNSEYKGNLLKGFLLLGNIGCGKSLIIETFIRVYNLFCQQEEKIHIYDSRQLFYKLVEDGISSFITEKMYIDDLGKEPLDYINYGFTKQPMIELLTARHEKGILTFATGNYKIEDYAKSVYNETITDRFREMFNILILKGNSKRLL